MLFFIFGYVIIGMLSDFSAMGCKSPSERWNTNPWCKCAWVLYIVFRRKVLLNTDYVVRRVVNILNKHTILRIALNLLATVFIGGFLWSRAWYVLPTHTPQYAYRVMGPAIKNPANGIFWFLFLFQYRNPRQGASFDKFQKCATTG